MVSKSASSRKGTVLRKNLEYLQLIEQNRAPPVKSLSTILFSLCSHLRRCREDKVERKGLSLLMIPSNYAGTLERACQRGEKSNNGSLGDVVE